MAPVPGAAAARPFIAFAVLALAFYSLLAHWEQRGPNNAMIEELDFGDQKVFEVEVAKQQPGYQDFSSTRPYTSADYPRRAVAHFLLANTYPFKKHDWDRTLRLATATSLDGLVLRLGKDPWQMEQARLAFQVAEEHLKQARAAGHRPLELFISLDMHVLPRVTNKDATDIADLIAPLLVSPAYMRRAGRPILSTFGGQHSFGRRAWSGFLKYLNLKIRNKVFFWPAWFDSPQNLLSPTSVADGHFAWNSAWPTEDKSISLDVDRDYLGSGKPYMAAVSPLFFAHYGQGGRWGLNKNLIYRSDDMLYPTRWAQLMALPKAKSPEFIQVLTWNDYSESTYIGPVVGEQPGSDAWTRGMEHGAFREMTSYFIRRWRDGAPEAGKDEIIIWMWYRLHPGDYQFDFDRIGRPQNADWARDLINIVVVAPEWLKDGIIEVHNGHGRGAIKKAFSLFAGHANGVKVPFKPGDVSFTLRSSRGVHLRASGQKIHDHIRTTQYNFNMWSRSWHLTQKDIFGPQKPPAPPAVAGITEGKERPASDDDAEAQYKAAEGEKPGQQSTTGQAWNPNENKPGDHSSTGDAWNPNEKPGQQSTTGEAWNPNKKPEQHSSTGQAWNPNEQSGQKSTTGQAWNPNAKPDSKTNPLAGDDAAAEHAAAQADTHSSTGSAWNPNDAPGSNVKVSTGDAWRPAGDDAAEEYAAAIGQRAEGMERAEGEAPSDGEPDQP